MRAIRFGLEMLEEIAHDTQMPPDVRQRAEAVLQDYPRPAELAQLLTLDHASLPLNWTSALTDAHALFRDVLGLSGTTEATRRSITVTLRHFPEEWLIESLTSTTRLDEWFEPEVSPSGCLMRRR